MNDVKDDPQTNPTDLFWVRLQIAIVSVALTITMSGRYHKCRLMVDIAQRLMVSGLKIFGHSSNQVQVVSQTPRYHGCYWPRVFFIRFW